jgi:hypothetical protein
MPSNMGIKAIRKNPATAFLLAVTILFAPFIVLGESAQAQVGQAQPEPAGSATLQGFVRDWDKRPVAGATVCLEAKDAQTLTVHTDSAGAYRFSAVAQGAYTPHAEMAGYGSTTFNAVVLGQGSRTIDLTLESAKASEPQNSVAGQPEFFDEPHFTVAGVTDTTSLGGHGSDAIVRNREALARQPLR